MSTRVQIDPLTGLRGIAAFCVVVTHYAVWCAPYQWNTAPPQFFWFTALSDAGMTLFFTLSGFVITYNYFNFDWRAAPISSFLRFAFLRFSRLYPVLLLFLALCIFNARYSSSDPGGPYRLWTLLHVFSVDTWVPLKYAGNLPIHGGFSVSWSISTEFAMYFMFAGVMIVTARRWRLVAAALLAFAAVMLVWSAFGSLSAFGDAISPIQPLKGSDWAEWFFYCSPYFRIIDFALGAGAGWVVTHRSQALERHRPWLGMLAAGSAVAVILLHVEAVILRDIPILSVGHSPVTQLLQALFFTGIMLNGAGKSRLNTWLSSTPLMNLGMISYSLYLFHPYVPHLGLYITDKPFSWGLFPFFILNFLFAWTLTIAFAWGLYHLVEVKAQSALRRLLPKRRPIPVGVQARPAFATALIPVMPRALAGGLALVAIGFGSFALLKGSDRPRLAVAASAEAAPPAPEPAAGAGSNLVWPSEDLTNARYRPDNAVIGNAGAGSPGGPNISSRLIELASMDRHRVELTVDGARPGAIHATSIFVKPAERTGVILEMRDNEAGKYGVARFDLKTAAVILKSGDVTASGVIPAADGWYRIWAAMPLATDRAVIDIGLMDGEGATKYAGDGKSGVSISGVQFEPASRPGPYIATTTSPAPPR